MSIRKKAMKRIITFVLLLAMAATLVNPLAEINVKASGIGGTELQKDETGLEDPINKTGVIRKDWIWRIQRMKMKVIRQILI